MILVVGVSVVVSAPAQGATTLGQTGPRCPGRVRLRFADRLPAESGCRYSSSYTVPAGGGVITSWSTQANANADKEVELKVFAPPHRDNIFYEVRGQEGPHILTAGALNTFPAQVKVEA